MKKNRVIARKHIQTRLPLPQTLLLWLLLDRLGVSGFWLGAIWAIWALIVVASFVAFVHEEPVDPFEGRR
jgi:hypothetical protein